MTSPEFDWKTLMTGDFSDGSTSQDHTPLNRGPLATSSHQQRVSSSASTSTLAQQQPRLTRPASSSSFLSVASSPGPTLHHSSPLRPSRTMTKRPRNKRAEMDVKVHYTLDSHPNSTLVATLGRPASVQVVHLGKKGSKGKSQLFGKVTLKTCLNAICMASPELMIDRKQDYVLYAVDPIESFRASQRPESANGAASTAPTSTRGADLQRVGSDVKGKQKAASSAFVVGKGFFSWALAESGDGQSLVHGRIRDEYAEEDDSDNSEEEDDGDDTFDGKVLEVSLRLKAASSTSRDQFIDRVKVFQTSTSKGAPVTEESPQEETIQREDAAQEKPRQPQTASSPVTASEREQSKVATAMTSTPAQQQLLQFLQALQAQAASATSPPDSTNQSTSQQMQQYKPPQQVVAATNTSKAADGSSTNTLNHLVHSFAAPSPIANTYSERQAAPLGATALSGRTVLGSFAAPRSSKTGFTKSPLPDSAASPILGGLTPGYEAGYVSRPSPTADTKASVPTVKLDEAEDGLNNDDYDEVSPYAKGAGSHRSLPVDRSTQCCYNCGIRSQRSWRHLTLNDDEDVRFKEGSIATDHGKRVYRSCNACGLYYNKYGGISRPEHVWREAQRLKQEQIKESERALLTRCSCSNGCGRMHFAAEDGDISSHAHSHLLVRGKQIARTLSEACERDTTRRMSVFGEHESDQETFGGSLPARRMTNIGEARLKDYVQDKYGHWRTKRSILENPENKRPGRPKGSTSGQARGRPRQKRGKRGKQDECQGDATENQAMTASSPGGNSSAIKNERREANASDKNQMAQSSPVRASSSANVAKTPGSAVNRAKYGAPSYLLDSSPATAFQTVLNEAETDWHTLCGLSPRRSPRKNPHGTQSGLNPYASTAEHSPTDKSRPAMDTLSALDLMKMTSSSPLTRGRVKSGHFQMEDTWLLSSDLGGGRKAAASSSLTSPGSPSPSPAHLKTRGVKRKKEAEVMLQPGQRTMQRATSTGRGSTEQNEPPQSSERARKAARQARQATSVGGASASVIDAGPFMGLDVAEAINLQEEEEEEEEAGGGSPTLGRSRRMRNKSDQESQPTHVSPSTGADLLNFTEDWARSTSMRELFPTPSPVKRWNMNSPSNGLWQSPTSWALAASSTVKVEGEPDVRHEQQSSALMELHDNQQQKQLIRRKPLPATVEDASSSVNSASSSPMDDEYALEEGDELKGSNLMDLFDDPYGLLAASGIGVQGNQPSLSMEDFESIELFKGVDFSQQLEFFTQMGSNGVAAHVAPSQGAASSSTLKIEGKGKTGSEVAAVAPNTSNVSVADFNALLKDPGMQAILAHMQLSPSKSK